MSGSAHGEEPVAGVETALHRLAPEAKVAATLAFVLAVALVPHGATWPYLVDAVLLAGVAIAAQAPPAMLGRRLAIELPFVLFVVLLPFLAGGPETTVLGVGLSEPGLWTAWGIVAKGTLAVLATGLLAWTTTAPAIVAGLERLHAPRQFVIVGAFAVRYLQVVLDELGRLQQARVARGDDPRWLWQAKAIGTSSGALAIRCLERGERVHGAMLARGFEGRMPATGLDATAAAPAWAATLALPVLAAAVTVAAHGGAL